MKCIGGEKQMALFDDVDQKLSNWINAGTDKANCIPGNDWENSGKARCYIK